LREKNIHSKQPFSFLLLFLCLEAKEKVKAVLKKQLHKAKISKIRDVCPFACRMHVILVTSYQRNEVEHNMG
jgi:hypothetical protein